MTATLMSSVKTENVAAEVDEAGSAETTRVFVSGLPPKLTKEQLAQHFSSKFHVTDAHVIPDRHIGFVGFTDAVAAHDAVKYFNKTYIRMSKITVDPAKPVQVVRNTTGNPVPLSEKRQRFALEGENRKRKRSKHDDGEEQRTEPVPSGSKEKAQDAAKPDLDSDGEATEKITPANDSDWLRGRTTRTLDLVDPDQIQMQQDEDIEEEMEFEPAKSSQSPTNVEKQSPTHQPKTEVSTARLFLRNLAFSATEADLRDQFARFGKIHEIHIVKDSRTSTKKGTAFIQFAEPHEAEDALAQTDGITFQGRLLHVLPASDKRDKGLTEYEISQMPLKKQKAVRRKLDAAKQTFSWNSLYMNPDAVLSSIADRLGVDKADILDPTSSDAAVKQAHAETQLIKDTKQFLISAGVNVDAFQNRSRDERCLLLKNFPFGTTEAELRALLDPFGSITKFILPPAGTMAFVQFAESYSALQAFKNLAYKNIKGSVLYIEKAPEGILDATSQPSTKQPPETPSGTRSGPTSTVFVKNLNFSTTTPRLQEITTHLPGYVSARIKTRTDAKRPGQVLSMGFGFVEFASKQQAEAAAKALNGHQVDGHKLVAQLSSKSTDAGDETRKLDQKRKKEATQTKIIIKNLPFQASKKDIRSLFSQYGELKMVRVPRKFDNTTRGFAFAEFVTPKEAENAMDALTNTHLLGRRLVLQFAEGDNVDPEEEIRAIERKVEQQSNRVHFNSLKGPGRKKFSLDTAQDDEVDV